jgi:outer membrane protein assembly factor BamD
MPRFARFTSALALTLATLALPCATSSCSKPEPKLGLSYTADAKRAYDEAMEEFKAHNWLEVQSLMREVKRKYSYSKFAKLAELRIADADYEQEKYADAIRAYRQFIHDHRSEQEEVAYARSKIAEADYQQIPDSFLLPAAEERDQATVMDAYKELRGYLHDYPNAKETPHIRDLLIDVTSRLVRHELYVARFYLQKDNYEAAIARVQYALRNFSSGIEPGANVAPDSGLEADALLLLGETYLKMHKWPEARASFASILERHPRSALTTQARNYLDYMQKRGV